MKVVEKEISRDATEYSTDIFKSMLNVEEKVSPPHLVFIQDGSVLFGNFAWVCKRAGGRR